MIIKFLILLISLVICLSPKGNKVNIRSCVNQWDCSKYKIDYSSATCLNNTCVCNYGFEGENCLCPKGKTMRWNHKIIGNNCLNNTECNYQYDCKHYSHTKCISLDTFDTGKCVCNYGFEGDDCTCPSTKNIVWNTYIKGDNCLNYTECIHDHHCKQLKYSKCFNNMDNNIGKCMCNHGFDAVSDGECLCSYNKILTLVNNQYLCLTSEECNEIGWYCTYGRLYVLLGKLYELLLSIIFVKVLIVLIICTIYKINTNKK